MPFRSIPARPFAASRLPISSLLATTSVAALLFALPTGALGGPGAGQSVNNQTVATVTNAAGQSITSIVITNSTVTGAVTNAGTITPGKLTLGPSPAAIFIDASTVNGGVLNSGTINAVVNQNNARAVGISITNQSTVVGGVLNTGTINSVDQAAQGAARGLTITNSTVSAGTAMGAIVNNGTITVSGALFSTGINIRGNSTLTGDIVNKGTITATTGQSALGLALGGSITGNINNTGSITVAGSSAAIGISSAGVLTGNISNTGTITSTTTRSGIFGGAFGIELQSATITGSVSNGLGGILNETSTAGNATGIALKGASVSGSVMNLGAIKAQGVTHAAGIHVSSSGFGQVSSIGGGVANNGTISASVPSASGGQASGIVVGVRFSGTAVADVISGGITNNGTITVMGASAAGIRSSSLAQIAGGITNTGAITVNGASNANGFDVAGTITGDVANAGSVLVNSNKSAIGISTFLGSITGSVTNSGSIQAGAPGSARGLGIGVAQSTISGSAGLTNSGIVIANGTTGIGIEVFQTALPGGITNTGTVFGSTEAVALENQIGTTITQAAGALIGSVTSVSVTPGLALAIVSPNVLNVTGGALSLQPTSTVFGFGTLNQSGGNVLLQVTPNNTAGNFPTVTAGNLTLSGVLEVGPQSGSFASGQTITYSNVFNTSGTLTNNVTSVQVFDFFSTGVTATLTPTQTPIQGQASLDLTLTNNSGMALTPGVASGAGSFSGLTNPLGGVLPAVSVTNGASVNGGIVNAGFIGVPGAPGKTGILVSGGQLSQPIVNTGTIAGTVAAIDVSGASAATTITQSAGTIMGAIKLSTNADVLTINGGTIAGDVVGAGTSDTVNIAPTNNANNTFTYGNTLSGIGAINIASGANLALTSQGVINNGGVLSLAPTSRITGTGAITQSGTTALQFANNTAAGAYPTINATTITLSGKLQVVLTGAFPGSGLQDFVKVFVASGTLTNSIAAGNVSVVTSGATLPSGTTVTAQLVQSGNSADVVVSETAAPVVNTPQGAPAFGGFVTPGLTPNEAAVAHALNGVLAADTPASQALLTALLHAPPATLPQIFDQLSDEVTPSTTTAAFADALLAQSAILYRLTEALPAPVLGSAATTTATYAADLPSRKGPALAPVTVSLYQPRMFDLWGQGFGDFGHVSSDGNAASLSRSTGGFVLGGDVSARGFLGGDWRFGLAGGYTNDRITVSQRLSSATFESVFGGAYAGASFGAVQLRAGALYGTNSTSTSRQVIFPGFSDALSSSHGGYTAQAFGEAGYRIELAGARFGWLGLSRANLEPFAGAAAFLIHQNGFTEGGGASALTGFARDFNIQTTTLGLRSELAFASLPVSVTTMLGWRHAYGDVVPSVLLGFQGGAQSFSSSGVPIDRDAFVAEAGVNYALSSMFTLGLSYAGQFGQRTTDNAFKGHLDLSF